MSGAFFYDADSDEELEFLNHEENSSGEDKAEERKGQAEAEEDEDGEEGEKPRGGKRSTDAESPWDARRHTTSIDEKISKAMKHRPLPISTEEEEEDVSDAQHGKQEEEDTAELKADDAATKPFFSTVDGVSFHADSFIKLNLPRPLIQACKTLGYKKPTPIQAACIPLAMMGRDLCASAITGSGKSNTGTLHRDWSSFRFSFSILMASVMDSDGETEEDVSADLTSVLNEDVCSRILLIGMKFGSLPWIRTSKLFHPSCRRETKGMCYEATTCGCYEKSAKGTLGMVLEKLDERGMMSEICDAMDLNHHVLDREATQVSGGELQRFSIAAVCLKKPDIYVFNKPFNFLDVRHRLRAAEVICSLLKHDKFGSMISLPTAYGVVTLPFSVREGINVFLAGFVPTENLRFRDEFLTDKPQESEGKVKSYARYKYPNMSKKLGNFTLDAKDQQVRVHQGQRAKACRIILLR
ncbi:unnamed protein product [Brassica napus]|uniref:(rape) hypothetical protein n=1 Tax=Brassica napus TaxID=3708 RepID=A0A816RF67_BRANA|nr:unnamed protein product [Brassica napus]